MRIHLNLLDGVRNFRIPHEKLRFKSGNVIKFNSYFAILFKNKFSKNDMKAPIVTNKTPGGRIKLKSYFLNDIFLKIFNLLLSKQSDNFKKQLYLIFFSSKSCIYYFLLCFSSIFSPELTNTTILSSRSPQISPSISCQS